MIPQNIEKVHIEKAIAETEKMKSKRQKTPLNITLSIQANVIIRLIVKVINAE